jgi:hypothetical protein
LKISRAIGFLIASAALPDLTFGDCSSCFCNDLTIWNGTFTPTECASFCSTNYSDYMEVLKCDDSFSICYCNDGCRWEGVWGEPSSTNCTGDICTSERSRNCTDFCSQNDCGGVAEYSLWGTADCLGSETLLYSCTADKYLPAKSISIGDSIRTMTFNDGSVCSEVYYVWKHKQMSFACAIHLDDTTDMTVVVSPNHLVYEGTSFSTRRTVRAKNVRPGDMLISKDGPKKVLSVEVTYSDLVNVLSYNPSLELVNGVIISAHSYHETLYSYVFWPMQILYTMFGAGKVEVFYDSMLLPALNIFDSSIVQPVASMLSEL